MKSVAFQQIFKFCAENTELSAEHKKTGFAALQSFLVTSVSDRRGNAEDWPVL